MRLRNPALIRFAGSLSGRAFKLLFATLNKTVIAPSDVQPYGADHEASQQRFIYSVWHDLALLAAFGGKHTNTVALTSQHRDGSFVESTMRTIHVKAIRGSTGRGGGKAARRLLETARSSDIIITPDGPRGPRRVLSKGIVYISSRTGNPIVPTAFVCANAWEIQGSWTTQVIPKPFSRAIFLAGDPIRIPPDIDRDELESYRVLIQREMDALELKAREELGAAVAVRESASPVLNRC